MAESNFTTPEQKMLQTARGGSASEKLEAESQHAAGRNCPDAGRTDYSRT